MFFASSHSLVQLSHHSNSAQPLTQSTSLLESCPLISWQLRASLRPNGNQKHTSFIDLSSFFFDSLANKEQNIWEKKYQSSCHIPQLIKLYVYYDFSSTMHFAKLPMI